MGEIRSHRRQTEQRKHILKSLKQGTSQSSLCMSAKRRQTGNPRRSWKELRSDQRADPTVAEYRPGEPIASTCSPASLEMVSRMSDLFVERMAKSKAQEEDGSSENGQLDTGEFEKPELLSSSVEDGDEKLPPFLGKQKSKLLQLRDGLLDLMTGVSRDTLRSRAEGGEASAFGMHQADAGSDAYDRDFALSLLSQEQLIFLC